MISEPKDGAKAEEPILMPSDFSAGAGPKNQRMAIDPESFQASEWLALWARSGRLSGN